MKYRRLTNYKVKKILMCFSQDLTATQTAKILQINRNTINQYFNEFRLRIFEHIQGARQKFSGEIELDESYFEAKRVRGKRGRGAAGKTPVFGIKKRNGEVYVEVVEKCSKEELMPIIQGKILEGTTVYTDGWKAYNGLILNRYDHYRVYHSHNEFARGKYHVNGIESFWSYCKRRLSKFNGMKNENFILHLKECEFRWNMKNKDLSQIMWKIFIKKKIILV
jgi:transposase-like protein